ncbi:hypothetical protein D9M70_591740 [compost metagenome]
MARRTLQRCPGFFSDNLPNRELLSQWHCSDVLLEDSRSLIPLGDLRKFHKLLLSCNSDDACSALAANDDLDVVDFHTEGDRQASFGFREGQAADTSGNA